MKTIHVLSVLLSAAILCSCGGSGKESEAPFDSQDLRWADLTGHVKECTTLTYKAVERDGSWVQDGEAERKAIVTFNEKGDLTSKQEIYQSDPAPRILFTTDAEGKTSGSIEGDDTRTITVARDAEGRIIEMANKSKEDPEYDDMQYTITYTWVKGYMMKESYSGWEWSAEFRSELDENGRSISGTNNEYGLDDGSEAEITYTYLAEDSHGNWTTRLVHTKSSDFEQSPIDDERRVISETTTDELQIREIEYY